MRLNEALVLPLKNNIRRHLCYRFTMYGLNFKPSSNNPFDENLVVYIVIFFFNSVLILAFSLLM